MFHPELIKGDKDRLMSQLNNFKGRAIKEPEIKEENFFKSRNIMARKRINL